MRNFNYRKMAERNWDNEILVQEGLLTRLGSGLKSDAVSIAKSLFGVLSSDLTLEESKEERLLQM